MKTWYLRPGGKFNGVHVIWIQDLGSLVSCDLNSLVINSFYFRLGDLKELSKHGSLHQYLLHLHGNGKVPVTSFWWGKTQVVSVCSPQAFKELVVLVNRPGMCNTYTTNHIFLYIITSIDTITGEIVSPKMISVTIIAD